ncbi:Protein FAM32A-like [Nibea albiflora]|uniref:Protein FAM32A-like n=1 Tax=Nibea albiflora TaxID=240163 RepID=A0ACB7ENN5_NIBAL|nr:Protein FAM32A-like [Nibea albiflora]
MSEYGASQKSALKLKGIGAISSGKKKKKKDKESKNRLEQVASSQEEEVKKKTYVDKRTPAQIAFDKMQEKRDFNRHLDNLTEHYDIPKVSWTK